ncbi:hypothetical protein OTU49_017517 [Cherax quadricarinatus]|uniref:Vacuolar ATPase assembly integral membrane protein VMA21 homolog n=2 Tax=Cherax quadricarinatus TaxID=27406 RepID=A0AAW0Y2L3_CHEQU
MRLYLEKPSSLISIWCGGTMAGVVRVSEDSVQAQHQPPSSVQVVKLPSQGQVLLKLLVHSVAMFTLPFVAYYTSKDFLEKEFGVEHPMNFIYGALCAVVMVQIIIFSYVYQAFKEEQIAQKVKAALKKE